MDAIKVLNDRIINRVNECLKEFDFRSDEFVRKSIDYEKTVKYYALYAISSCHPVYFRLKQSNIAGSYFMGRCRVDNSIIYKSDIRGDELKRKGDSLDKTKNVPLLADETIIIRDSLLYKTLVHSNSHNPETPEEFRIGNTISGHYSNIHGSTLEGCFIGAFATVDLMNLHSCIVGEFSYIQVGELFHKNIEPGVVWIRSDDFEFTYKFDKEVIDKYIGTNSFHQPRGIIYEFVKKRERDFEEIYRGITCGPAPAPESSVINRYAAIKCDTKIGENVLVAQCSYLENAEMEKGANAQENCYIVNSRLRGNNVTAHGGKIIDSDMGRGTFVGFNCFLNGKPGARIAIGENCILMPHTIIDSDEVIEIPGDHIVWGFIGSAADIQRQSISIDALEKARGELEIGEMVFKGNGSKFVKGFRDRIQKILLANGAFFDGRENRGHAQKNQLISFNTLQPYHAGENIGLYPSIKLNP